ncbi:MAG: universal stress protein [Thermodesulfobacteriaceae bacterium]|nr:universal stress protein [Thermodesulfobacteriaceae bacterium]
MEKSTKLIPHLLLCYDESLASKRVLNYLKTAFKGAELELTFLHIISISENLFIPQADILKELKREEELEEVLKRTFKEVEANLKSMAEFLQRDLKIKFFLKPVLRQGEIGETILRCSKENLYDGIIIGRRGLSKMGSFIMGSVSYKLLHLSEIPVWIIRGEDWNQKFLVALDREEMGLKIADYVTFILKNHPLAEINFLHVTSPFVKLKIFEETLEGLVTKDCGNEEYQDFFFKIYELVTNNLFDPKKIRFKVKRALFGPAGDIIREVKKGDYGTVVVGKRGKGGWKGFVLGSVSQKIVNYFSDRAVWVVN